MKEVDLRVVGNDFPNHPFWARRVKEHGKKESSKDMYKRVVRFKFQAEFGASCFREL